MGGEWRGWGGRKEGEGSGEYESLTLGGMDATASLCVFVRMTKPKRLKLKPPRVSRSRFPITEQTSLHLRSKFRIRRYVCLVNFLLVARRLTVRPKVSVSDLHSPSVDRHLVMHHYLHARVHMVCETEQCCRTNVLTLGHVQVLVLDDIKP